MYGIESHCIVFDGGIRYGMQFPFEIVFGKNFYIKPGQYCIAKTNINPGSATPYEVDALVLHTELMSQTERSALLHDAWLKKYLSKKLYRYHS